MSRRKISWRNFILIQRSWDYSRIQMMLKRGRLFYAHPKVPNHRCMTKVSHLPKLSKKPSRPMQSQLSPTRAHLNQFQVQTHHGMLDQQTSSITQTGSKSSTRLSATLLQPRHKRKLQEGQTRAAVHKHHLNPLTIKHLIFNLP